MSFMLGCSLMMAAKSSVPMTRVSLLFS